MLLIISILVKYLYNRSSVCRLDNFCTNFLHCNKDHNYCVWSQRIIRIYSRAMVEVLPITDSELRRFPAPALLRRTRRCFATVVSENTQWIPNNVSQRLCSLPRLLRANTPSWKTICLLRRRSRFRFWTESGHHSVFSNRVQLLNCQLIIN